MPKPKLVQCNRACAECDVCHHAKPHEGKAYCTDWGHCGMPPTGERVAVRCVPSTEEE